MSWKIRNRGEDLYHHIYAWGNNRHPIFKDSAHYHEYLSLLESTARDNSIEIIAYALMERHVHLFIHDNDNAIANFMMRLHGEYAQFFNRTCRQTGHVFGERYNNKIVTTNLYFTWLSRYIHRQAVEAGLTTEPESYRWTSYNRYLGNERPAFVNCNTVLDCFGTDVDRKANYIEFVMGIDEGPVDWGHRIMKIRSPEFFVNVLSAELNTSKDILVSPHDRTEKKLRRKASMVLYEKFGLSIYDIAKILMISPSTVSKFKNRD